MSLYWSYQKVRDILEGRIKFFDVDPKILNSTGFTRGLHDRIVEYLCEKMEKADLESYMQEKSMYITEIVTRMLESGGLRLDEPEQYAGALNDLLTNVASDRVVRKTLTSGSENKFFLEPTIAEAMSTTSVKGLTCKDLPPIPVPFSVFLPYNLVKAYTKAEGTWRDHIRLRSLHLVGSKTLEDGDTQFTLLTNSELNDGPTDPLMNIAFTSGMMTLGPNADLDVLLSGEHQDISRLGSVQVDYGSTVVRIIINTLLYWKSENPDILRVINPEYDKVRNSIKGTKGSKRERRRKKLKETPQHPHFIVGSHLKVVSRRAHDDLDKAQQAPGQSTGRRVAEHRTRGHWKWQPCGEGRSKRKLIFVEDYVKGTLPPKEKLGFSVRT